MSAAAAARRLMPQRATFYAEDIDAGSYPVATLSAVPCRLAYLMRAGDLVTDARVQGATLRQFYFDAAVSLTIEMEQYQIMVDGVRYNPMIGSFFTQVDLAGEAAYHECIVQRAS